jgi:TM2 domain-containing membrane protein YozV
MQSHKSYTATLLLTILLGWAGIHRFYIGKVGTGVLYFLTFGLFGIGWLIDIISAASGNLTDKAGAWIKPGTSGPPGQAGYPVAGSHQASGIANGAAGASQEVGGSVDAASSTHSPYGRAPAGAGVTPGESGPKPFYTRWWFITIAVIVVLYLVSSLSGGNGGGNESSPQDSQETQSETVEEAEVEEADPEPAEEDYTTAEKLAVIDEEFGQSDLYERRFGQVQERCPNTSEERLGDYLVRATQLLEDRAITESTLWGMEQLLAAIPPGEAGTVDCAEVLSLLVSTRISDGP